MATKVLKNDVVEVTTSDVSNGYITVDNSNEINVYLLSRAGAINTNYTENSPVDGTITIPSLTLGEVITVLYYM